VFRAKLPDLFKEVKDSLLDENLEKFASQLDGLEIGICESFASDDSAFTISFTSGKNEDIEDTFPTRNNTYTVMLTYSKNSTIIGLDVIGCEKTNLQKQLMACCT
jgi:hypothetical protein